MASKRREGRVITLVPAGANALRTSRTVQTSSTGIDERAAGDVRARAHVRLHRAAYNKKA